MKTNGHYAVLRRNGNGVVTYINCCYCSFSVDVRFCKRLGDRSGLPKYNRARARVVKHLHESHRDVLGNSA